MRLRLPILLLALVGLLPLYSYAQTSPLEQSPLIISPASGTYTRSDSVFPRVAFASTSQIIDVEYLLGDTPVAYDKPLPFFETTLGTTSFSVITKDVGGAIASSTVVFTLTATPQSTIDDVKEMYKRGLVTKVVVRDRLVRSLELFGESAQRLELIRAGDDKRKEERAALVSERLSKILDSDILDFLKKQEGRTIKKGGAVLLREDLEYLKSAYNL